MFALKSNIFPLFSFFRKVFSDGREEVFLGFKASILVNGSILSFNQKGSWFIQKGSWFVQKGSWFVQKGSWFVQKGSWFVQKGSWFIQKGSWFIQKGSWFIQKGSWFVQKGSWFIQKGSWFIQWNFYFNKKPPSLNKLSHLFIWKSIENIHEHSPPFVGYF